LNAKNAKNTKDAKNCSIGGVLSPNAARSAAKKDNALLCVGQTCFLASLVFLAFLVLQIHSDRPAIEEDRLCGMILA
jgi:hypothetical protein